MLINRIINKEVAMYLDFCEKAALHDEQEALWKKLAAVTFQHITELRSTNNKTPIS